MFRAHLVFHSDPLCFWHQVTKLLAHYLQPKQFFQHHFEITNKPPLHHCRPNSPAHWSWSQLKTSILVLQIGARPGFPPREVKTTFFLVVSPLQQGLQFVQWVTLHFKAIEGLIRKLTWQSTTINDLTSGWWGHPIASMCRPLLDRSFNRDIAGPENTDFFNIF